MTRLRLSPIRTLRRQLGLSQGALARYLNVSRELITQVEADRRTLPATAHRKLTALLNLLPPAGPASTDAPSLAPAETETAVLAAFLKRRLRDCRHETARARRQLEQLAVRAACARRCLLVVPPLLAAVAPSPTAAHEQLWLELLAADATAALTECGAAAQALLEVRIGALEVERAELERRLLAVADAPPPPA